MVYNFNQRPPQNIPNSQAVFFRMNGFMKEWFGGKSYLKTAKKLEFEVEKRLLKEFIRYVTKKRSKSKSLGLSFEVRKH